MKQLLQYLRDGKTVVEDIPVPAVRKGMVLIRNHASLVSAGTERMVVEFAEKNLIGKAQSRPDLVKQVLDKARREGILTTAEATFNRLDKPMLLGYSSAGTVIEVGENVTKFQVGDRVACAGGGYAVHAEFVCVPEILVTKLPPQVDFESAAFTTLGAIAMHGFRLARPQIGEKVAIIGLGILGLISIGIAKAAGCSVFGIDINPERLKLGDELGAVTALNSQAEDIGQSFTQGQGFDTVLICADTHSNDTIELAGKLAGDKRTVVAVGAVGLNIPRKIYYEKELNFLVSRSYGPGRYDTSYEEDSHDYPIGYVRWTEGRNMEAIVDLLANQALTINQLITHRFPIEKAPEAYELITGKRNEPFLGVLLTYAENQKQENVIKNSGFQPTQNKQHNTQTPKIGVLGAGNYATAVFLPAIKKAACTSNIGIASASGVTAQNAAKRFGFSYSTSSEEQIISDENINTVVLLNRHNHHARQTIASLKSGKHVYCEKPLALNQDELKSISDLLEDNDLPLLMCGFNRRFAKLAVLMKKSLQDHREPLVAHYTVNAGYLPLSHWLHDEAQGGGRIIGEGCHFIDFITYLVGSPPIEVSTISLPDNARYKQDNVAISLVFKDGSIGTLHYLANGDKSFPKERVEVFTAGKVLVLNDFRSLEITHNGHRKKYQTRLKQDKGHLASWKTFIYAIKNESQPPIPYNHLIGVTQTTFAAMKSLQTGNSIKISTIDSSS